MVADAEAAVFAVDEQTDEPVDLDRWGGLARAVLAEEGVDPEAELSLLFVDEAAMTDLNTRFMGEERPTDVLAFPIDELDDAEMDSGPDRPGPGRAALEPQTFPVLLGDVVICPAVARRNAPTHAGTYEDELALLVVHGILHVLGMDHAEPEETQAMQAAERRHLELFHPS